MAKKIFDDTFLLITAVPDGCFVCDFTYDLKAQIFDSIEGLVNHFHDMMDGKVAETYPVSLHSLDCDGTIEEELDMIVDSGCFTIGLAGVRFKYNNITHKLKRGGRK